MTSSAAVPPERETIHSRLKSEVDVVKEALLKVLKLDYTWPCCNCSHQRGYTNAEEGISAGEVREAVEYELTSNHSSSVVSIALYDLLETGAYRLNSRLRIVLEETPT